MKPEVEAKLKAVSKYPFFQSCGHPLPKEVKAVQKQEVAIKECSSLKWQNCRLMASNALFDYVQRKCWERGQEWNPLADELRPLVTSLAEKLVGRAFFPEGFHIKLKNVLSWDIMHICFEEAYSDLRNPFFFIPLLDRWYAAGHLPCGWDGEEFPEHWDGTLRRGSLIVF
jgi:hypothetical protein